MRRHVLACSLFLSGAWLAAQTPAKVDFGRDVQPILKENCYECHGSSQQMRGLRLDRRRDALPNRVGANNARIIPGNSSGSLLYRRLTGTESGSQMPPRGALRPEQISVIKAWIDQGAEWPDALSGEVLTVQPDPGVVRIMQTLRNGDQQGFNRALAENRRSLNAKGQAGWTPLMYAALYGNAQAVRLLLDQGANANAQNDAGGTALMYAIEDAAKIRLLLDHGADPNTVSGDGRTALRVAAARFGSNDVVKLLLEKGAKPLALAEAVIARDASLLQLLLDHGSDSKPLPLAAAVRAKCAQCFELLLKMAGPDDLKAGLPAAVTLGNLEIAQTLLDRGAQSEANILQAVALSATPIPGPTIQTLINRGASVSFQATAGMSILDLAKRQGNNTLVQALMRAGATDEGTARTLPAPKPADSPKASVERSLPALQRADVAFLERAGCISCHNNSLTGMTRAAARAKGLRLNEPVAQMQLHKITAFLDENRERAVENLGLPGGIDTVSYILLGLAAEKYPSDSITDVWARYVKNNQSPDGRWQCLATRPPIESSDFEVTAASIRSLRAYSIKSQRSDYDRAVERGVRWLEKAEPLTTEDSAFKVLGLVWGGGNPAAIQKTAQDLLKLQRADGGWAQLPTLSSDAYATGQALVALHEARAIAVNGAAYQRGVKFLLNSQLEDGSWYVQTRTLPVQPYFDSDFPHGRDQFISAAATNWASMALISAVPGR